MIYLLGITVAVASLFAAINHLHQHVEIYTDFVAFVVVLGGTSAVAVITFPWKYRRELWIGLRQLIVQPDHGNRMLLTECINFVRNQGAQTTAISKGLPGQVLRDGAELKGLGFSMDRTREILETRILQSIERSRKVANAFRALAKYPPAFGLTGTVLGLVSLMRAVSSGADARTTGVQMAVALIATFYGLLTANLIVNPAGELTLKLAYEEQKQAEIALNAVMLSFAGANPLEAQEVLNSHVSPRERVNVISSLNETASVAA